MIDCCNPSSNVLASEHHLVPIDSCRRDGKHSAANLRLVTQITEEYCPLRMIR